jgi:tetratricopeptide (TPR) repeat protein
MVRHWIAVVSLVAVGSVGTPVLSQGQTEDPLRPRSKRDALPALVLVGLPPDVRTELQRAYDVARDRATDGRTVGGLAMMLHAFEQFGLARSYYSLALRLDERAFEWRYLLGVVQAELGENAAAVASFRLALSLNRQYLPAHIRLAESLMRAGDLEASRAEYVAVLRGFPDLALANYGLGRVESAVGRTAAAIVCYRRALEAAPEFGAAHYALALAYRNLGDAPRAQPHLAGHARHGNRRPALADPLLDRVRSMRSTARDLIAEAARRATAGNLEESVALHLTALDRDPSLAQVHVNLISLYGRTGRHERAEAHYRAALELGASVADAHYNYGVLLAARRRQEEAVDLFRQALEANPFHAAAHGNLAALLARNGRFDEAARHYRLAIANDPNHPTARANLERVLALSSTSAVTR